MAAGICECLRWNLNVRVRGIVVEEVEGLKHDSDQSGRDMTYGNGGNG